MVWFRLNIGRERNADPRWLLPLICRQGGISKAEIGAIKIYDRDTRFQIVAEAADQFALSIRTASDKEGQITRVGQREHDGGATPAPVPDKARSEPAKTHRSAERSAVTPADATPSHPPRESFRRDRPTTPAARAPHRKGGKPSRPWSPGAAQAGQQPNRPTGDTEAIRPKSKYAHKKKGRPAEAGKG